MAAFVKALNARIRANPAASYFCSTHFWGPASNFTIPLAAIADARKSPELISGPMTLALSVYSATFMRFAFAVTPRNYLLFLCHFINEGSQLTQGYRYLLFHHFGGKEEKARAEAAAAAAAAAAGAAGAASATAVRQATMVGSSEEDAEMMKKKQLKDAGKSATTAAPRK